MKDDPFEQMLHKLFTQGRHQGIRVFITSLRGTPIEFMQPRKTHMEMFRGPKVHARSTVNPGSVCGELGGWSVPPDEFGLLLPGGNGNGGVHYCDVCQLKLKTGAVFEIDCRVDPSAVRVEVKPIPRPVHVVAFGGRVEAHDFVPDPPGGFSYDLPGMPKACAFCGLPLGDLDKVSMFPEDPHPSAPKGTRFACESCTRRALTELGHIDLVAVKARAQEVVPLWFDPAQFDQAKILDRFREEQKSVGLEALVKPSDSSE